MVEFLTSLQVLPEEETGASLMTASQAAVVLPAGLLLLSLLWSGLARRRRGRVGAGMRASEATPSLPGF